MKYAVMVLLKVNGFDNNHVSKSNLLSLVNNPDEVHKHLDISWTESWAHLRWVYSMVFTTVHLGVIPKPLSGS